MSSLNRQNGVKSSVIEGLLSWQVSENPATSGKLCDFYEWRNHHLRHTDIQRMKLRSDAIDLRCGIFTSCRKNFSVSIVELQYTVCTPVISENLQHRQQPNLSLPATDCFSIRKQYTEHITIKATNNQVLVFAKQSWF